MFVSKILVFCICSIAIVNADSNFQTKSEDPFLNDLNLLSRKNNFEKQERRIRVNDDERHNLERVERETRSDQLRSAESRQENISDRLADDLQMRLEQENQNEIKNEEREIRDNRREIRENLLDAEQTSRRKNHLEDRRFAKRENRLDARNDRFNRRDNRLDSVDRNRLNSNEDRETKDDKRMKERRQVSNAENRREMNGRRLENRSERNFEREESLNLDKRVESRSQERKSLNLDEKFLTEFNYTSLLLAAVTSYLTLSIPKKHLMSYLNQFKETISF